MRTYLLLIGLLLVASNSMYSQNRKNKQLERRYELEPIAKALQTGGLVVYVPTNTGKIAALRDLIAEDDLVAANRQRLQKRLDETIESTRTEAQLMKAAFAEFYDIGPIYFMPDTALVKLRAGVRSGLIYDEEWSIDTRTVIPKNILVVRPGNLDPATTSGAEGLLLTNSAMEPLPKPMPSAVAFNNFAYFFNRILAKEMADRKLWDSTVRILDRRLEDALERYDLTE